MSLIKYEMRKFNATLYDEYTSLDRNKSDKFIISYFTENYTCVNMERICKINGNDISELFTRGGMDFLIYLMKKFIEYYEHEKQDKDLSDTYFVEQHCCEPCICNQKEFDDYIKNILLNMEDEDEIVKFNRCIVDSIWKLN